MTTPQEDVAHAIKDHLNWAPKDVRNAAEIGVYRGALSKWLLTTFANLHLVMVDTWKTNQTLDCELREGFRPQKWWDKVHREALDKTSPFSNRRSVVKKPSLLAAKDFPLDFFDFVFIDAGHQYPEVLSDIQVWTPKVKHGGVVCGHDIDNPRRHAKTFNWRVRQAVEKYLSNNPGSLLLGPPETMTWFFVRP